MLARVGNLTRKYQAPPNPTLSNNISDFKQGINQTTVGQPQQQQSQPQHTESSGPNLMQKLTEMTAGDNSVDHILSKGKELIFMKFGLGKWKTQSRTVFPPCNPSLPFLLLLFLPCIVINSVHKMYTYLRFSYCKWKKLCSCLTPAYYLNHLSYVPTYYVTAAFTIMSMRNCERLHHIAETNSYSSMKTKYKYINMNVNYLNFHQDRL